MAPAPGRAHGHSYFITRSTNVTAIRAVPLIPSGVSLLLREYVTTCTVSRETRYFRKAAVIQEGRKAAIQEVRVRINPNPNPLSLPGIAPTYIRVNPNAGGPTRQRERPKG